MAKCARTGGRVCDLFSGLWRMFDSLGCTYRVWLISEQYNLQRVSVVEWSTSDQARCVWILCMNRRTRLSVELSNRFWLYLPPPNGHWPVMSWGARRCTGRRRTMRLHELQRTRGSLKTSKAAIRSMSLAASATDRHIRRNCARIDSSSKTFRWSSRPLTDSPAASDARAVKIVQYPFCSAQAKTCDIDSEGRERPSQRRASGARMQNVPAEADQGIASRRHARPGCCHRSSRSSDRPWSMLVDRTSAPR